MERSLTSTSWPPLQQTKQVGSMYGSSTELFIRRKGKPHDIFNTGKTHRALNEFINQRFGSLFNKINLTVDKRDYPHMIIQTVRAEHPSITGQKGLIALQERILLAYSHLRFFWARFRREYSAPLIMCSMILMILSIP